MSSSKVPKEWSHDASGEDTDQCMAALVRVITYAREEAKRLEATVLTFCLDAAVTAATQECSKPASAEGDGRSRTSSGQKKAFIAPVH